MKFVMVVALLLSAATAGCTKTTVNTIETGMFENDPVKIESAHDGLEKKLDGPALTKQDVECLGFDLKAPNVQDLPGPIALKRIFGEAVFRDMNGVERPAASLKDFEEYRGYLIPYQSIETVSDRIYISEVEIARKGISMQVLLLFKKDTLCYSEIRVNRVDAYFSHYAFADGIIILMQAPGKAALNIMEKLHEYEKPGLQFFVPIPIP